MQKAKQASALLSQTTVVSFEQAVAAPYCTSRLAQDGARVIKVERPEGDFARGYDDCVRGESSYFIWLNAGKEAITLDLRSPDDLRIALAMVDAADVVVQNLARGALDRIGIDLDSARARRPELIICSISGYGPTGAYAAMKAYDLLIQAESGLCAVTGGPEAPARVGISICDIATGMQAYAAIIRALLRRQATGVGETISASLFGTMSEWMAVPLLQTRYGNAVPQRIGVAHPTIAPYGAFRTSDNVQLVIAVQNDREWGAFAEALLPPGTQADQRFKTNILRVRHRVELDALIAKACQVRNAADLSDILQGNKIAFAQLRALPDVLQHPAFQWLDILTPAGRVQVPMPGTGMPDRANLSVPSLDQHGRAIRREFS
jgi:itaconate CoA-transferase